MTLRSGAKNQYVSTHGYGPLSMGYSDDRTRMAMARAAHQVAPAAARSRQGQPAKCKRDVDVGDEYVPHSPLPIPSRRAVRARVAAAPPSFKALQRREGECACGASASRPGRNRDRLRPPMPCSSPREDVPLMPERHGCAGRSAGRRARRRARDEVHEQGPRREQHVPH